MSELVVLDASAVLAFLQDEQGSEKLNAVLLEGKGVISTVNYAEIIGKLFDAGLPDASVRTVLESLDLRIEPLDETQAWMTGKLRIITKKFGLSLGDRACLALACAKKLPVITSDKQWQNLDTDIQIIQLR